LCFLKTDIKTKKEVEVVRPLFNNHPIITDWSIDTEDIDNVLRIQVQDDLKENEIIHLIKECGFYGEMLAD